MNWNKTLRNTKWELVYCSSKEKTLDLAVEADRLVFESLLQHQLSP